MLNLMIHRKLILSYVFLAVLPTIILGAYLSNTIKSITVNRTLNDAVKSVEIIQSELSHSLNVPIDVSTQLYINQNFFHLVGKQYTTTWDVVNAYFQFKDFEGMQKVYRNQIDSIRVYTDNDTILEGWYLNKITDQVVDTPWYRLAIASPSKVVWCPTERLNTFALEKQCYSLVRLLESGNMKAIVLIDLNMSYLKKLLGTGYLHTTLYDKDGLILSTNSPGGAMQTAQGLGFDTLPFSNQVTIQDGENQEGKTKIIIKDMKVEGVNGQFRIVSTILLTDILQESNRLFTRYIAFTGFCLAAISGFVLFFSRNLRNRVGVLRHEMELVSKGDFALVSTIRGNDEIGVLSQSLNIMATNLKALVAENDEANLQKQNLLVKHNAIKLKQLTNQINPHFLFNTLESLRMEARLHDELEISDTIRRLGGLLRKSIQTGSEELPLMEEISLVEDYLRIQAFRYGERIQYAFSISKASRELRILPFLVQPIVENAIIHGLENSETTGMININAFCDDHILTIEVIDNGVGMSPEKLQQVRESLNDDDADDLHIGLRNVHLRIRIRYGQGYGLAIDNEAGKMTKVTLRIPKVVTKLV